ncbi:hypothetical protein PspLS_08893 [Pyricularia sp. CBS 133598]|nr:hypothetical protein PspLS_08893 [Pyricularia sp. CBS 133598]
MYQRTSSNFFHALVRLETRLSARHPCEDHWMVSLPRSDGVEQALSATHSECPAAIRGFQNTKYSKAITHVYDFGRERTLYNNWFHKKSCEWMNGMSKDYWFYNQHLPCNHCNLERARNRWDPASSFPIISRQADLSVCLSVICVSLDGH